MATLAQNTNNEEENQQAVQTQSVGSTIQANAAPNAAQSFNQSQAAPQQQRQVGSGHFTNIQKYLGANKQAGQQLGQNLQQGIGQKLGQAMATSGRELGEAKQQQQSTSDIYSKGFQQYQQLGGTQNITGMQAQPIQGAATQAQKQTFEAPQQGFSPKGVTASEYSTNIGSRQQASRDIAGSQDALKQFSGLRTGSTQSEQQQLISQQNQQARDAAEAVKRQQEQRMKQLATESGRAGLLGEFVGGKDYTGAKRSLDLAFLQKDPNRATDTLKRNIGAKAADVRQGLQDVAGAEASGQQLGLTGRDVSQRLAEQSKQNVQDYVTALSDRISTMEQQRGQKMDWARQQLADFQAGKGLNKEFQDLMNVEKGTQLFNVPKNIKDVGEILDVEDFKKQQLGLQDVSNVEDVANYQAMAQLAGLSPNEMQLSEASKLKDVSQFAAGDQRTMQARAEKAKQDFLREAANKVISGETSWVGGLKGQASQNLLDFLSGGNTVAKQVRGASSSGFGPGSASELAAQGGQILAQLAPSIGSAASYAMGDPTGLSGAAVGQLLSQPIAEHGMAIGQALETPGGDLEKAGHGFIAATNPSTYLPGTLGDITRGMGETLSGGLSQLAGSITGVDDDGDRFKNMGYARRRSDSYLENALASYLKDQGFYNYMGEQGMKAADIGTKGTWDGQTWLRPGADLEKFGYGKDLKMNLQSGKTGTYSPAVLEELVKTGQLENFPKVT